MGGAAYGFGVSKHKIVSIEFQTGLLFDRGISSTSDFVTLQGVIYFRLSMNRLTLGLKQPQCFQTPLKSDVIFTHLV